MFQSTSDNSDVNIIGNTITNSGNENYNFNIENLRGVFTLNGIQNEDLQSLKQPLMSVKSKVEEIFTKLKNDERFEILAWLSKVDYKEHHEFIRSGRHANTGHWLLDKNSFREWNESKSSIFWLHGIAGAGKTVLASTLIDMLMNLSPTNQRINIAYFYCKYGEVDRQDPKSILSTIVKQIALMSPEESLPKAVISLYQEQIKDGVNNRVLSIDKSTELIIELSGAFKQTVIIVDALDECDPGTRYKLLAALKKLLISNDGLKIFVTSRDDMDIRIQLETESNVYIQRSDNSRDIERFVEAEVERYISERRLLWGDVSDSLKRIIIDTLNHGADGMFLWVRLQMEHIIKEVTEDAIRMALKQLPKGLKATYSEIWGKIQDNTENNCRLADRIFKWIICAKSPLNVEAMMEAVSITPTQWKKNPDHNSVTVETLLHVCQNLIVLDEKAGVFRTAHFSVTEFLLEKLDIIEAHTAVAEVCLALLCYETHFDTSRQTDDNIRDHYALRNYAINNWEEHIRLSGGRSDTIAQLQKIFFGKPSPEYHEWLKAASENDPILQPKDARRPLNPLWVACYLQWWDVFKYLLDSNTDCTMKNRFGTTPIHWIARHEFSDRDFEDVKLLLEQKSVDLNVNVKDNGGRTPLYAAACAGHERVVRLLLEVEDDVDLNTKDNIGRTPLYAAACAGHEGVVRMLRGLEGVDVSAKDDLGRTPLHAAAGEGYQQVVRLLLGPEGLDLNTKDDDGRTPLHVAAYKGHGAVVRVLIKQVEVELNAKIKFEGWTPLYAAAREGHTGVVRMLGRQKDVELNSKDVNGRTPLHAAARMGRQAVVTELLELKDVDLNAKDHCGRTPLYDAACAGHEAVIRLLLKQKNVDLNIKTKYDGWTPLDGAKKYGHAGVVKLLLEQKGVVDLNANVKSGETSSHFARRGGGT